MIDRIFLWSNSLFKSNKILLNFIKILPFLILFSLYFYKRIDYINESHIKSYKNNDFLEYEKALDSLLKGENPYTETIKTYNYKEGDKANPDHGFAYFPLFFVCLNTSLLSCTNF